MLVRNDRSKCNPEHRLKVHKRFIQHTTYPRDIIGRFTRCDTQRESETERHTHNSERASEQARDTVCAVT